MENEILKLLKYKDKIENGELSFEEFKIFLENANAILRNKTMEDEDTGIYKGYMTASDLVSPTNEVQLVVLEKYYNILQNVKSSKAKSALSYYILLDLHLFSDGNGRLARFMYQLFDKDFDIDYVVHNESDYCIKGRNFEEKKDILFIDDVNNQIAYTLLQNLIRSGKITNDKRLRDVISVRTYGSGIVGVYNEIAVPENIKEQLNEEEMKDLNRNLNNNNSAFTVAGITMCVMLSKLGKLSSALDRNDEKIEKLKAGGKKIIGGRDRSVVFSVGNRSIEESSANFEGWTAENFRQANRVSERIHQNQLEILIDIFANPRKYMLSDGRTILSRLINENELESINQDTNDDNEAR